MIQKYIPRGAKAIAAIAAMIAPNITSATEHNLVGVPNGTTLSVAGDVGGTALVANYWEQPTGTGVFDPFLSLDANGQTSTGNKNVEQAYNSDAMGAQQPNLYLDQHRPQWNTLLKVGDLARLTIGSQDYYAFILDANEPGAAKSLISVDNIRIYTSATDNTANVADDMDNLDALGTLRWAMNDPLATGNVPPVQNFNDDTWIKLDAAQETVSHGNANGGSGQGDMIVYIPVTAFGNALETDYLWFYNLNGTHYDADAELASTAGFEEWRAVTGTRQVPEGGSTLALLGSALTALGFMAHRRKLKK